MTKTLRNFLLVAVVLLGRFALATATKVDFSPSPARHAILDDKRPLLLIKDGVPNLEIVLAPELPQQVKAAAVKELKEFLEKAFSASVPVVSSPSGDKISLALGISKLTRDLGVDVSGYARDAFVIKAFGNIIVLAGHDDLKGKGWSFERGSTFAVYEFLERFLGVRFYFPGELGTVVPQHRTLSIPSPDILERPDFHARKHSNDGAWFLDSPAAGMSAETLKTQQEESAKVNRPLNILRQRMQTRYIPNCHSLERSGYLERFADSNPEYFALTAQGKRLLDKRESVLAGNLCFMNPGFRETLYQDAKAFLSGVSAEERGVYMKRFDRYMWDQSAFQEGFFNIMPMDWFVPCHCDLCHERHQQPDKGGNIVWELGVEVARRLQQENIPGYVTMMSYGHYTAPPPIEFPDNLLVMVAVAGPWEEGGPTQQASDARVRAWRDTIGKKVWLWNYTNKYGARDLPGIPCFSHRIIAQYYQRIAKENLIFGSFLESESDRFLYQYLNYYVYAKVAWDNQVDVPALLHEHYQLMFEQGAAEMQEFYDLLEDLWVRKVVANIVETAVGSTSIPPSSYDLWHKVYTEEMMQRFVSLFDAAEKKTDGLAKRRVGLMREQLLQPLQDARAKYLAESQAIGEWACEVSVQDGTANLVIDGKLDDPLWQECHPLFLLPAFNLKNIADVCEVETQVRIVRDEQHLYIAYDCREPQMPLMVCEERQRDDARTWSDSSLEIFLYQEGGARQFYYQWIINAVGSISDYEHERIGAKSINNLGWNSNCQYAVQRLEDRWTAEVKIPLAEIAYNPERPLRGNFNRSRYLKTDKQHTKLYTWSYFIKGFHAIDAYGILSMEPPPKDNLLRNGTFSAPQRGRSFGPWHASAEDVATEHPRISLDRSLFIKDGQSIKLHNPGPESKLLITQYLEEELKENTSYHISFMLRLENIQPSKAGGGVFINPVYSKNNWFPKNPYTGNMPWTRQGFTWTTGSRNEIRPNVATRSYIRLYLLNATGTAWFDDVSINEIK